MLVRGVVVVVVVFGVLSCLFVCLFCVRQRVARFFLQWSVGALQMMSELPFRKTKKKQFYVTFLVFFFWFNTARVSFFLTLHLFSCYLFFWQHLFFFFCFWEDKKKSCKKSEAEFCFVAQTHTPYTHSQAKARKEHRTKVGTKNNKKYATKKK